MMTAGQVWLVWALLTKKDTKPSKQLQLDVSAPASQQLDTDWTEVLCRYLSTGSWNQLRKINPNSYIFKLKNNEKSNAIVILVLVLVEWLSYLLNYFLGEVTSNYN